MYIATTETHQKTHHVALSKSTVESILKDAIRGRLDLPVGGPAKSQRWSFTWDEESIDSGLRKEPRITVRVVEDLAPGPSEEHVTKAE